MPSLRSAACLVVATGWLFLGSLGTATAQDRPDLLDVAGTRAYTALTGYNFLYFALDEVPVSPPSANARRESAVAHLEKVSVDQISLRLYEPDKVTRKADSAKLSQKDRLVLFTRLAASSSTHSGVVTGCKGLAQVKQSTVPGDKAFLWKFSCANLDNALTQIGVTPGGRTALLGLFGTNGKLLINGKIDCGTFPRCTP